MSVTTLVGHPTKPTQDFDGTIIGAVALLMLLAIGLLALASGGTPEEAHYAVLPFVL